MAANGCIGKLKLNICNRNKGLPQEIHPPMSTSVLCTHLLSKESNKDLRAALHDQVQISICFSPDNDPGSQQHCPSKARACKTENNLKANHGGTWSFGSIGCLTLFLLTAQLRTGRTISQTPEFTEFILLWKQYEPFLSDLTCFHNRRPLKCPTSAAPGLQSSPEAPASHLPLHQQ